MGGRLRCVDRRQWYRGDVKGVKMDRNELIVSPRRSDSAEPADEDSPWDLPPEDSPTDADALRHQSEERAAVADRQAARGHAAGDGTFAYIREEDAKDFRQRGWGSGDARTWGWVALMCIGFLIVAAIIYFMPYGRHAAPPPVRVY